MPRDDARERKLLRAARRGDVGARERLLVVHLDLVRRIAAHYRNLGLASDDLVQEGAIGLLEAFDRYDPTRDVDFETFARFRIRRAIRKALTEQARLVRLPKQIVERRRLLGRVEGRLAAGGRVATPKALAAATGLSERAVLEAQTAATAAFSLDAPAGKTGIPLVDLVADRLAAAPDDEAVAQESLSNLREAVNHLSRRRHEILRKRYGLDGDLVPLSRIAADLHLSERRTRTLEHDALREVRERLERADAGDSSAHGDVTVMRSCCPTAAENRRALLSKSDGSERYGRGNARRARIAHETVHGAPEHEPGSDPKEKRDRDHQGRLQTS